MIHNYIPPAAVAAAPTTNTPFQELPAARDDIVYYGSGNHQRWMKLVDKVEHNLLCTAICRELICKQQHRHQHEDN
jgi:hypothetical protein